MVTIKKKKEKEKRKNIGHLIHILYDAKWKSRESNDTVRVQHFYLPNWRVCLGEREWRTSVYRQAKKRLSFEASWNIHIKGSHIENNVLTHLKVHHQTSKRKVDG